MKKDRKTNLLKKLKKNPIVQIACKQAGVSRATYYRWRKEDKNFRNEADKAIFAGEKLINDMAESQLIAAIRDQNLTAIIFWLKHHHAAYATKVDITARFEKNEDKLTPEQEEMISKAMQLSGLSEAENSAPTENKINKKDNYEK